VTRDIRDAFVSRGIDALGKPLGGPAAAGYDPDRLAAVAGPASRFDRPLSPRGWSVERGENAGAQWLRLADAAQREAEPQQVEVRRVHLRRVGKVRDQDRFVLVPRGTVEAIPQLQLQMPRRIGKVADARGGALIDSFLARAVGGPWTKLRDSAIWRGLLEWAQETQPTGQALRSANDAVAIGILTRHGIQATAPNLSHGLVQCA
jgi:hypothetical protein